MRRMRNGESEFGIDGNACFARDVALGAGCVFTDNRQLATDNFFSAAIAFSNSRTSSATMFRLVRREDAHADGVPARRFRATRPNASAGSCAPRPAPCNGWPDATESGSSPAWRGGPPRGTARSCRRGARRSCRAGSVVVSRSCRSPRQFSSASAAWRGCGRPHRWSGPSHGRGQRTGAAPRCGVGEEVVRIAAVDVAAGGAERGRLADRPSGWPSSGQVWQNHWSLPPSSQYSCSMRMTW